jgi:hypothetical protein
MRKIKVRGLVATLALLAGSATGAFADLGLQIGSGQQVPASWTLNLAAIVTGGNLATNAFNNMRVYQLGAAVLTTVNGNFNVASTPFEDYSEFPVIGMDDSHRAIGPFLWFDGSNGLTANTWAQTSPGAPPLGATVLSSEIRAAGNTIPQGPMATPGVLAFSLFFAGDISNGAHFQVEFWNGTSFVVAYDVKYIIPNGQTAPESEFSPRFTAIPLPPAVWSGLAMMAGFGAFLTKRRRDRKTLV